MITTKVVYIAGPYSATVTHTAAENVLIASWTAKEFLVRGIPYHCPHLNTHKVSPETPYSEFIALGIAVLTRCDAIYMLPGWRHSHGTIREMEVANKHGIPCADSVNTIQHFFQHGYVPDGVSQYTETITSPYDHQKYNVNYLTNNTERTQP